MKYILQLDKTYDYNVYEAHSTQYTPEELMMAAIIAKKHISEEVLSYYTSNLIVQIKVCTSNYENIYVGIDYERQDVFVCSMINDMPYTYSMYTKDNASGISSNNEKHKQEFMKYKDNVLKYMLIMHCEDIINICRNLFNTVCVTDATIHKFISEFQNEHKEKNDGKNI